MQYDKVIARVVDNKLFCLSKNKSWLSILPVLYVTETKANPKKENVEGPFYSNVFLFSLTIKLYFRLD